MDQVSNCLSRLPSPQREHLRLQLELLLSMELALLLGILLNWEPWVVPSKQAQDLTLLSHLSRAVLDTQRVQLV